MIKNKKYTAIFLFFSIMLVFSSCTLESECNTVYQVPASKAYFPDSIKVNSTGEIIIHYLPLLPCSNFREFDVLTSTDTIGLILWAEQTVCDCDFAPDSVAVFSFTPTAKRDYIFRLYHYTDSIIQDTIRAY